MSAPPTSCMYRCIFKANNFRSHHRYAKEGEVVLCLFLSFIKVGRSSNECIYGRGTIKIFNEQLLLAVGLGVHLCDDLLRSPGLHPDIWWYNIELWLTKKYIFSETIFFFERIFFLTIYLDTLVFATWNNLSLYFNRQWTLLF